jgi:hypothetical protein
MPWHEGKLVRFPRKADPRTAPRGALLQRPAGLDIEVTPLAFAGKSMPESQRMVYGAIAHLMNGDLPDHVTVPPVPGLPSSGLPNADRSQNFNFRTVYLTGKTAS